MEEDLTPLSEARDHVLSQITRLESETVPLAKALGRVAAAEVIAVDDVPPFRNSAMDGYAVRASDVAEVPAQLKVIAAVAAGAPTSVEVAPRTAIKIMTGGAMPEGADAVVPVEMTTVNGPDVVVTESVEAGAAVRPAGSDVTAGTVVLRTGTRLSPYHVGVLASVGETNPTVSRLPVVAIMSTGNEVMSPQTEELLPGQIRDTNRSILRGLLDELGVTVLDMGILRDDRDVVVKTLTKTAEEADVVVTSGGVSMGEFDYIKAVMAELGSASSWKVAMQPAKPFTFGIIGDTPVFGLPGNPVSVSVGYEQFLRPALLSMMGASNIFRPRTRALAATDFKTAVQKTVFLRVLVFEEDGEMMAALAGGQGSHQLGALAAADGFAVVERGVETVRAGEPVWVELHRDQSARR
jgi:molybdenum cofactor synthesis domain-containing protein